MIDKLFLVRSGNTDPYLNIALEKYLTEHAKAGSVTLFLWQNRHTVVIGRNQNAFLECNIALLSEEGGLLARRLSGGGAVYHDLGNLNFTFAARKEDYDVSRQTDVILKAVRALGIASEKTGRNDLTTAGRKYSGHAYYQTGNCCCHHGTLMVGVDKEKLGRYLTVSQEKLESKGVRSVRARVANLNEFCPGLTVSMLEEKLVQAFEAEYGLPAGEISIENLNKPEIEKTAAFLQSKEWLYGRRIPFTIRFGGHYSWGGIEFRLMVNEGRVRDAEVFSDAMDAGMIGQVRDALYGVPFRALELTEAVRQSTQDPDETVLRDLEALFRYEIRA